MAKRIVVAFDIIDENNESILKRWQANSVMTPLLADNITNEDIHDIELELSTFLQNARANEYIGHLFHRLTVLHQEGFDNNKWTEASPRPLTYLMKRIEFPHWCSTSQQKDL